MPFVKKTDERGFNADMGIRGKLWEELIQFDVSLFYLRYRNRIGIGENVRECLESDLKMELKARPMYVEASKYSHDNQDFVTRELFEHILESEEEHIDWLETQLELIDKVGEQNYLQSCEKNSEKGPLAC